MTKERIIVAGGGFKGIISAYLLNKKGHDVTLIETAPFLGGIMRSRKWKDYSVDNGVHLFDSVSLECAQVITEIMNGDVHEVGYNYGSHFNGVVSDDLAIPDFTVLDDEIKKKILFEMCQNLAIEQPEKYESLYQRFLLQYGKTAADIIDTSFQYIYKISSKEIEPSAINQTTFHRLKFLKDEVALELKKQPVLDDWLAAKRINRVVDPNFVSIYPGKGGMLGFCEKSEAKLEENGVKILLGTKLSKISLDNEKVICDIEGGERIEADRILWAGPPATLAALWKQDMRLMDKTHKTPMVMYTFETEENNINDYTYFHQFSPELVTFRPTSAGVMSKQVTPDGKTFIVAECPTEIGSEIWENPEEYAEQSWKEIEMIGLTKPGTAKFLDVDFVKVKQTYNMPKVGAEEILTELDSEVENTNGRVILPNRNAFLRREIYWAVEESIGSL